MQLSSRPSSHRDAQGGGGKVPPPDLDGWVDLKAARGGIRTFTGRLFYPLKPVANSLDIFDIAHSLSQMCRYAGHTLQFYSVAQHSVLVARTLQAGHHDADVVKWGLLHDASEAYLLDMPSPLKKMPGFGDGYRAAERKLMRVIIRKFGLTPIDEPEIVQFVDRKVLVTEQRDLMNGAVATFDMEPLATPIDPWVPIEAEAEFLELFGDLFIGEGESA